MRSKSRLVSVTGILAAMSTILYVYPTFPIIPAFPWLKMDFADVPALFASVLIHPVVGGVVILIRNAMHLLISSTGMVGELSNFIISALFVVSAGIFSRALAKNKSLTLSRITITMIIAMVVQAIVATLCNKYIMIPLYGIKGDPAEYILMGVLPFNLIKTAISSTLFVLIYKALIPKIKQYL
ncbi:MAG: ECF transporter S component [Ruminococcaceae bacterium]|nr:ECF transporter S component [Oscillospiraceae bacterium]